MTAKEGKTKRRKSRKIKKHRKRKKHVKNVEGGQIGVKYLDNNKKMELMMKKECSLKSKQMIIVIL